MKIVVTIFLLLNCGLPNLLIAQSNKNNPENIVLTYKSDGTKAISYKDELSRNPDSLNQILYQEVQEGYKLKMDYALVKSLLVGKWSFKNAIRTTNIETKFSSPDFYSFYSDGSFSQASGTDTSTGKWSLKDNATILLNYDKPFVLIKDTAILKYLDSTMLKNITFDNVIIMLHKLEKRKLMLFTSLILGNDPTNDKIHYRIILLNYGRTKL